MKTTKETKKTTIEEALIDYNVLLKEANKTARDKFISENGNKFDKVLNEEIKKFSNKKSDKEPITEGNKKELVNNKKSEKINEEVDLTNENMDAVKDVYDNANLEDDFQVEAVGDDINFDEIEKELLQMDQGARPAEIDQELDFDNELGGEIPDMSNEAEVVTDPYTQFKSLYEQMGKIVNDMEQKEQQKEYMSEFENHLTEMFGDDHNLEESEFNSLYEKFEARKNGAPYGEGKLNENESEPFDNPDKSNGESDPFDETDKKNIKEMKETGGMSGPDMNKGNKDAAGGPTQSTINEEDVEIEIKDDDEEKEELDEIHGQSYSAGKVNAGRLPNQGAEYRDRAGHSRNRPEWSNEAEKKMKTLLEDKKKLSKKMNEYRTALKTSTKIVEQYKGGLKKYREHLQEMAIFNTNLSHVNNILVESVENKEDVKGIINKFKNIGSIDESKKVFKLVMTEMKQNDKEVISEEVEAKLNKEIIGESSSVNGDKSKVITESAYKNDAHLNKLKKLITYQLSK